MDEGKFKTGLIKVACRTCKGEKTFVMKVFCSEIPPNLVDVKLPCTDCKGTGYYEVKKL